MSFVEELQVVSCCLLGNRLVQPHDAKPRSRFPAVESSAGVISEGGGIEEAVNVVVSFSRVKSHVTQADFGGASVAVGNSLLNFREVSATSFQGRQTPYYVRTRNTLRVFKIGERWYSIVYRVRSTKYVGTVL